MIAGPAVGGVITDHATWRLIFYVNLPMGILALIALAAWLPVTASRRGGTQRGRDSLRRIDVAGAVTSVAATTCLLLGLTWGGAGDGWGSGRVFGAFGAAAALYLAFVVAERFAVEPLLPLDMFRNRVFTACVLMAITAGAVFYAVIFYLPLFLQGVLGQAATSSGAAITPLMIPVAIGAIVVGQAISQVGRYKVLAIAGAVLLAAGAFLLSRLGAHTALGTVTLDMIVVGIGAGVVQPALMVAAQNVIPIARMGAGTGAVNYLAKMGQLIGTAVFGALVAAAAAGGGAGRSGVAGRAVAAATRAALATGIHHVFLTAFGLAVITLLSTLVLKDVPLRKRGQPGPVAVRAGDRASAPARRLAGPGPRRCPCDGREGRQQNVAGGPEVRATCGVAPSITHGVYAILR